MALELFASVRRGKQYEVNVSAADSSTKNEKTGVIMDAMRTSVHICITRGGGDFTEEIAENQLLK